MCNTFKFLALIVETDVSLRVLESETYTIKRHLCSEDGTTYSNDVFVGGLASCRRNYERANICFS